MRIVMMGTGPFAVPTFRALLEGPHEVPVLVTRPLPPARGRRKAPINPMRDVAEQRGVAVWDPPTINTPAAREQLHRYAPQLLVVCDYGQILSAETLAVATRGGINLHGSLLPKYRGAAPVQWAIYHGEVETGVTVIHMTPQLDGGPALVVHSTRIGDRETSAELEPRLAELGVEAVREALAMLADWDGETVLGVRQDARAVTRAPRLKKSDGLIQWHRSAHEIACQVRAFQPWPGSYIDWKRSPGSPTRLIINAAGVCENVDGLPRHEDGCVLRAEGDQLLVQTGDGVLAIETLQPAGKRPLGTAEFLRGYHLSAGDRL